MELLIVWELILNNETRKPIRDVNREFILITLVAVDACLPWLGEFTKILTVPDVPFLALAFSIFDDAREVGEPRILASTQTVTS
jgi:hypothetical protein